MANPKIFVELSLDDKVYKQRLSDTLTSTQTTAKGIETSWKALGVKNDATYDAQRRAYENAMTLIKNSTTSTAQDIIRAEQAKADKIRQLDEQQHGKHTSMMQSMKANWMGMAAAATAAYLVVMRFAAEPIQAYMEQEAAIIKMAVAMRNQGDYTRAALTDMEDFSAEMQKSSTVGDEAALSMMANLKSYGMSNEEVKRATKVSIDFAAAKKTEGLTVTTASELIGKAFAGNTATMSRYGIVLQEGLSPMEKYEAAMAQLQQRFGGAAQGEIMTYAGQWAQLKNTWGDIQEVLGYGLLKSIEGLLTGAGLLTITFMSAGEAILITLSTITTPFTFLLSQFAKLAELAGLTQTADALRSIASATDEARGSITAAKEGVLEWTSKQYDAMVATDRVTAAVEKMGAAGKKTQAVDMEAAKAAKKAAEEAQKLQEMKVDLYIKEEARKWKEVEEYEKKHAEDLEKAKDEEIKLYKAAATAELKAIEDMMDEIDKGVKESTETIKKAAEKRGEYEREIYKDLRSYANEYYTSEADLINTQAEKYKAAGVDQVAVAEWVTQQLADLDLKKLKSSDAFTDGAKAGFIEMKDDALTFGQAGYEAVKTMSEASRTALQTILFQGFKTGTFDIKQVWDALLDTILGKFTTMLAQMVIDFLAAQATMATAAAAIDWVSAIFAAKGIWDLEGPSSGIPVIAHPGEMILPADVAEMLRNGIGSTGAGSEFEGLREAIGSEGLGPVAGAFMSGTGSQLGKIGAIGMGYTAARTISPAELISGLISPEALSAAVVTGGIPAAFGAFAGLDPTATRGYGVGYTAAGLAGLGNLAGIGVGILGMLAAEGIMDALDARYNEAIKDALEDTLGWVSGHFAYADLGLTSEFASTALGNPDAMKGWRDFGAEVQGLIDSGYYEGTGGEYFGGGFGGISGGPAEPGGYEGGSFAGFKRGGVASGPDSGYWAKLHGREAIVPLPGGGAIPVKIAGQGGRAINYTFNLYCTVADKRAVNAFADQIYPRLKRLEQWGH